MVDLVRWTGMASALLALTAAVPGATWRLIDNLSALLRRRRPTHRVVALFPATWNSRLPSITSAFGGRSDATLPERVEKLEREAQRLDGAVRTVATDLRTERAERVADVERLLGHIDATAGELRELLLAAQRDADRINASALPVAAVGIVLSTVPEALAHEPVVGVAAYVMGLLACLSAVVQVADARPVEQS